MGWAEYYIKKDQLAKAQQVQPAPSSQAGLAGLHSFDEANEPAVKQVRAELASQPPDNMSFDQFLKQSNVNQEFVAEHPTLSKVIAAPGYALQTIGDLLPQGVQNWGNRASQTGGEIATLVDNPNKVTTGSQAGDISADIFGSLAGFAANPGNGLNAGAGLWKLGEEGTGLLLGKVAPNAPKWATEAGKVAGATVPFETAAALGNNRPFDLGQMGESAAANAGLSLLLHGAGRAFNRSGANSLTPELTVPQHPGKDADVFGVGAKGEPVIRNTPNLEQFKPNPLTPVERMRMDWNAPAKGDYAPEVKNPFGPTPSRTVDASKMPDKYPLPNTPAMLRQLGEARQLPALTGNKLTALPRPGEVPNFELSNGYPVKDRWFTDPYGVTRGTPGTPLPLPPGKAETPAINLRGRKGNITYPPQEIITGALKEQNPGMVFKRQPPEIQTLNDAVTAKKGDATIQHAPEAMNNPEFAAANQLAKTISGRDVVPFKGVDNIHGASNGRTIWLNAKSDQPMLYVTSHELTHDLKTNAPEVYTRLENIVLEHVNDVEGLRNHYTRQGYRGTEIPRELTADAMAESMMDGSFWARVRRQSPELLKPVLDALDSLIARFRQAIGENMTILPYLKDVGVMRARLADEYAGFLADAKAGKVEAGEGMAAKLSLKQGENTPDIRGMILEGARNQGRVTYGKWADLMGKKFPGLTDQQKAWLWHEAQELRLNGSLEVPAYGLSLTRADLTAKAQPAQSANIAQTELIQPGQSINTLSRIAADKDKFKIRQVPEIVRQIPGVLSQGAHDVYTALVDNLHPMARAVERANPTNIMDNFYRLAMNSRNAQGTADYIISNGLVDKTGVKIGESLASIEKDIPRGKEREFADYLFNKHNIARMEQKKPVFGNDVTSEISRIKAQQYEADYPEFKELGNRVNAYVQGLSKAWGTDTGLISDNLMKILNERYPDYVPTYRETAKDLGGGINRGRIGPAKLIKTAIGGDQTLVSPMESLKDLTRKMVTNSRKNEVYQAMLNLTKQNPEAMKPYIELMSKPELNPELDKSMGETGAHGMAGLMRALDDPLVLSPNKGNFLTVMENGKAVSLRINDNRLWKSLQDLSQPRQPGSIERGFRSLTNPFKALVTGDNPVFAVMNISRDIPTAYVQGTNGNPLSFGGKLGEATKDVVTKAPMYQEYLALGGGHGNFFGDAANTGNISPLRGLRKFNNATETIPRYGEYKATVERGGGTYESKMQGLYNANEVTTNFGKHGNLIKALDAGVPYLNAGVQGADKFLRQMVQHPVKTGLKGLGSITVPTTAIYLMNKDNPNYEQLSNYTKDTYYCIPNVFDVDENGNAKTFIKIPKSRESGAIFGTLFERIYRQVQGDPNAWKDFGTDLINAVAPSNPITNNILAPAVYNLPQNQDFAGRKIVPSYMQKLSPELQYDASTTEPAKVIGQLLGVSPKQVDYLIKSYTGIIGQVLTPATSQQNGSLGKAAKNRFVVDPLYSNDILNDFYDAKDKQDTAYANSKAMGKKAPDLNPARRTKLNKASDAISDIQKQVRKIDSDSNLSADDKENRRRILQQRMLNIAQNAMK